MIGFLHRHVREFFARPSGTRFRRVHARRRMHAHPLRTALALGAGLALLPIGIALLVLPGPGVPLILLGASLIAGESLIVATWLDRADSYASGVWIRWRRRHPSR